MQCAAGVPLPSDPQRIIVSKTLSLKKPPESSPKEIGPPAQAQDAAPASPVIETFTEEQLMEQLLKLRGEKPLPPRPEGFNGIWDHTSMLPVVAGPKAAPVDPNALPGLVQLPAKAHGSFSLNGIPLIAPGVDVTANINPASGLPFAQVTTAPKGGMISPPPSRNFR